MPRGNMGETARGMFDDLKSKLGFNRDGEAQGDYGDYGQYSDFGEYDDYGDQAGYDDYAQPYGDAGSAGGYQPLPSYSSRSSRYASDNISTSLVSIDDVKATTPLPDLEGTPVYPNSYQPAASGSTYQPAGSAYQPVASGSAAPAVPAAPSFEGAGAPQAFGAQPYDASAAQVTPAAVSAPAAAAAYDPYEAYSGSAASSYAPARALTVVRPAAYGDVERVARAVKGGDVVVLAMHSTPDDLSKRVLDFSFGVASALDANVECPAEKVFAIARGTALTPDEKRRLAAQGVL